MGNCWNSSSTEAYSNNPRAASSSTQSYTPATSKQYSNEEGTSGTGSSAGKSMFSEAASGSLDDGRTSLREDGQILDYANLKEYTFAELKASTKNFRPDSLLGEGGFGLVYRGWVDEKTLVPSKFGTGMMVAIKKLKQQSEQGFAEWQSEVNFLGRLSHPNLVKLLGYCWEDKELLLVYEYMQRGSLENHLFRKGSTVAPLPWDIRLKIAVCAARGLAFLHTSDKQVIYRDFKASNILIDGNYNAKISDFGLAKFGPEGGDSHVTTRIMGTYGYAAPEYIATGHLYIKSDVYGFGVVLLEILTGLRAHDTKRVPHGLVDLAKPCIHHKRKLKNIMDARLEGQYSITAAFQAAQLALKCIAAEPRSRPSMKEVVEELEKIEGMGRIKESNSIRSAAPQNQQFSHAKAPFHLKPKGALLQVEKR
uniref:non-specific serine/threonine protein kinase n=1 Tax=Kalanchoe fedtschenkoi TaxID=63787 RepID=A0A7N0UIY0_KALFE